MMDDLVIETSGHSLTGLVGLDSASSVLTRICILTISNWPYVGSVDYTLVLDSIGWMKDNIWVMETLRCLVYISKY